MEVLRARGVEKAWSNRPILRGADLSVETGERVGLVGVNGSGKSTLVRIVAGQEHADAGAAEVRGTLGYLDQDPELPGETVADAADDAVRWHRELHDGWQAALAEGDLRRAATLQARLDEVGWEVGHRVDAMLSRVGAPPRDARIASLSGGERRRVALARALLGEPDLLILDEPTNHLDADTIEWLQSFLVGFRGALLLVTHDRYLLEAVATRIVEVEDGVCVSYDGSYTDYLLTRAERRAAQQKSEDQRLSMIAREAEWASRSPAAQTTKQKARLDRLAALQAARPLLKQQGFSLDLRTGLKHGSTVLELRKVRKALGGRVLMKDLDLALRAGDRMGILGPNGAGKTTMLRLATGEILPDAGEVERGARVRIAVLDQARSGLPLDVTVFEAAGGGNDQVKVGERWIHVASFLGRFLFPKEFHHRRVETLSGGERARLLLAKLLLQGANFLLLDEPTNDLDLQTLQVLEEALLAYDGVLLVVTHDRAFLDRVCNAVVAFEGEGRVVRYADRRQHLLAMASAQAEAKALAASVAAAEAARAPKPAGPTPGKARRLSFKEQKELDALPAKIEALESEQGRLADRLADPAAWRDADGAALSRRLSELPAEIEAAYARWSELDALR